MKKQIKIRFSSHVINDKLPLLLSQGWQITKSQIKKIISNPTWEGFTKNNQPTMMGLIDENHILRIVYRKISGIILVITIHVARRGRYENTK